MLDFQDVVCGPVAYDLVCLFKDAFLSWPIERVDAWLARYHALALAAGLPVRPWPQFLRDADWMGVQRHLKILGLFVRLRDRDGKGHYFEDASRRSNGSQTAGLRAVRAFPAACYALRTIS